MHELDRVRYATTRSHAALDADGADVGATHDVAGGFVPHTGHRKVRPCVDRSPQTGHVFDEECSSMLQSQKQSPPISMTVSKNSDGQQ